MKFPKIFLQPVFKVSVLYKSGTIVEMEYTKFSISGGTYTWDLANYKQQVLLLGVDEIAAVYQTGVRWRIRIELQGD